MRSLGLPSAAALLYLVCSVTVLGSNFDPKPLSSSNDTKPFFEGWYARVIDHFTQTSFAVIIGAFKPVHGDGFSQQWVALLRSSPETGGLTLTDQIFVHPEDVSIVKNDGSEVSAAPDPKGPADFVYTAKGFGYLKVSGDDSFLKMRFNSVTVEANFTGRFGWSSDITDGPEGWLGGSLSGLLPCHYYVHTMGSPAAYKIEFDESEKVLQGGGYAHMETNYGQVFPSAWIWAQGISEKSSLRFVLTGGKFTIGPISPLNWIIAVRKENYDWTFRTTDLDSITQSYNACEGWLKLKVSSRLSNRILEIDIRATPKSFSEELFAPTETGFSNFPGCQESFQATAIIKGLEKPWLIGPEKVLFQETVELSALEFGQGFKCKA